MTTNTISIEPFEAEYPIKLMGGGAKWYACTVVGIVDEGRFAAGRFLMITEDEGCLYASSTDKVRRVI